jgi:hypothetical protein
MHLPCTSSGSSIASFFPTKLESPSSAAPAPPASKAAPPVAAPVGAATGAVKAEAHIGQAVRPDLASLLAAQQVDATVAAAIAAAVQGGVNIAALLNTLPKQEAAPDALAPPATVQALPSPAPEHAPTPQAIAQQSPATPALAPEHAPAPQAIAQAAPATPAYALPVTAQASASPLPAPSLPRGSRPRPLVKPPAAEQNHIGARGLAAAVCAHVDGAMADDEECDAVGMSDVSDGVAVKRPRLEHIGVPDAAKCAAKRSDVGKRVVNTGPESQKLSDKELAAQWA